MNTESKVQIGNNYEKEKKIEFLCKLPWYSAMSLNICNYKKRSLISWHCPFKLVGTQPKARLCLCICTVLYCTCLHSIEGTLFVDILYCVQYLHCLSGFCYREKKPMLHRARTSHTHIRVEWFSTSFDFWQPYTFLSIRYIFRSSI